MGGDVHQAYLHEVTFRGDGHRRSAVYQATCSPFRNPLDRRERAVLKAAHRSRLLRWAVRALARAARVPEPEISWRLAQAPTFDNQLARLDLDGRSARLRIECTEPGACSDAALRVSLDRRLA